MSTIFTIGHLLPKNRAIKPESLISYLKGNDITTVLDVRYLPKDITGSYSPQELSKWLTDADFSYLTRTNESFLFFTVAKDIVTQPARKDFFRTHYIEPLVSFLDNLDTKHRIAILFNYWDTYNLKKFENGTQKEILNIKGTFCKFMYKIRSDVNLLHIVPKTKSSGCDCFTGYDLYEKAYGHLLTIRDDMWQKSQPPQYEDYNSDDNWGSLGDDEWRGMNEESDGAAYWNID